MILLFFFTKKGKPCSNCNYYVFFFFSKLLNQITISKLFHRAAGWAIGYDVNLPFKKSWVQTLHEELNNFKIDLHQQKLSNLSTACSLIISSLYLLLLPQHLIITSESTSWSYQLPKLQISSILTIQLQYNAFGFHVLESNHGRNLLDVC